MSKVHVMDHPLIQHKLTLIRNKETGAKEFRELVEEVALLMAYEVYRICLWKKLRWIRPSEKPCKVIAGKKLGIIPILQVGLGMVDGMIKLIPAAGRAHRHIQGSETLQPVEYYCKLPTDIHERDLIVVDPMLATGGSASAAIDFLKQRGAKGIKLVCLIAAPEGIERVQKDHDDVDIFVAAVDERLNDHGYIVPGLGDAGDRLFGTK